MSSNFSAVLNALAEWGWALPVLAGALGLLVGSFLNVVILRLPPKLMHDWRGQSREILELDPPPDGTDVRPPGLVWESSHCPHCHYKLGVFDNIPLLSWLVLRGRCRNCEAGISIQYPLVELLTAVVSALVVWRYGPTWQAGVGLCLSWVLVALAGIDFRTQLLPDQLTLPLLWLGLLISPLSLFVEPTQAIVGAAVGYLSLWSVYWAFKLATGKEGMGHGDFKLLAALGAWMGANSLLPIILLSAVSGAVIGGIVLVLQRQDRATPIPFGPFIACAGWLWFVFGDRLSLVYLPLISRS